MGGVSAGSVEECLSIMDSMERIRKKKKNDNNELG